MARHSVPLPASVALLDFLPLLGLVLLVQVVMAPEPELEPGMQKVLVLVQGEEEEEEGEQTPLVVAEVEVAEEEALVEVEMPVEITAASAPAATETSPEQASSPSTSARRRIFATFTESSAASPWSSSSPLDPSSCASSPAASPFGFMRFFKCWHWRSMLPERVSGFTW